MRSVLTVLSMVILAAGCKSVDKKEPAPGPAKEKAELLNAAQPETDMSAFTTIEWLDSTYLDLGQQKEGKTIELSFRFKNTGDKNLVIENVSAQCGCTIPEKPEQPFAPGEEGVIKATFNGSGHDETRKQVYIKANIKPDGHDTLTFRAQLIK